MGQIVHALIEHRLNPDEILELPKILKISSNYTLNGQWHWTAPHINKKILIDLWSKKAEYFINNSWSEEDLALLEKDNLTLHFITPKLLTFDNSLKWWVYNKNEDLRKSFNDLAKELSKLCKAVDILIVPDLSDDFINSHDESKLTVDIFRQHAVGDKNLAIEVD